MKILRPLSPTLAVLAFGCSVIATSEPAQCATDNDCYVKFSGAYTCQAGGCVLASSQTISRTITTLDECRSTQECVAVRGEGWLCRRDRDDHQKKGRCQQLTATDKCTVMGSYENDQVIMLGAILPGSVSPALNENLRRGLNQAVDDWQTASRRLAQTNTGAEAVAPPRPFAILACTEEVPMADLRNLFLNSGVTFVIGPAVLRAGATEELAAELTNAKLLMISPTSVAVPRTGSNVGTFFFRMAGDEKALSDAIVVHPRKPTVMIRRNGAYDTLAGHLKAAIPTITEATYDDPATFATAIDQSTVILGDGEVTALLPRLRANSTTPYTVHVLPTAVPEIAPLLDSTPLPNGATLASYRVPRNTTVPATPFPPGSFGDAETYDAVYSALVAIAAVPDAIGADSVATEILRKAFVQVTAENAPTKFKALPAEIRDIVKQLRATPDGPVSLEGASGALVMSSSQNTTRAWTACVVNSAGCGQ